MSAISTMDTLEHSDDNFYVALTDDSLNANTIIDKVRSPKAGAIVLFAGTTRDNFDGKPVKDLKYTSYKSRALQTMISICKEMSAKHSLTAMAIVHRLGVVPIGEESILIAVATPHRQAAWKAGEEALELCKEKVEIWKLEEFTGDEPGIWRANRDGATGSRVDDPTIIGSSVKLAEGETLKTGRPFGFGHGPVVNPKQSGGAGDLP